MLSPRSLELAQSLVRLNTVSANSNLELIHFIRDTLQPLGVRSRLTYNADKTKANLFATLGEGKPGGIILSGHTDTVPWDGQAWSVDPLSATVKDGRLYGRGSADMKAFIAIAVAHAQQFLDSDAPFAVHFAFSYDEEVGCFGVRELIADMRDAGIQPLACIVGEPTSMVPAIAHKGVYRYKCCVRGKEAHSSLTPQSVNAIEMAARLVGKVRDMAEGFERHEPRYEGFDVPFSTASVGQFHGGIADNVVPRDAEFRYEFRDLPTADAAAMQAEVLAHARALEPAMKQVAPDAGFWALLFGALLPLLRYRTSQRWQDGLCWAAFGLGAAAFRLEALAYLLLLPLVFLRADAPGARSMATARLYGCIGVLLLPPALVLARLGLLQIPLDAIADALHGSARALGDGFVAARTTYASTVLDPHARGMATLSLTGLALIAVMRRAAVNPARRHMTAT